jgi:hypothetical protein
MEKTFIQEIFKEETLNVFSQIIEEEILNKVSTDNISPLLSVIQNKYECKAQQSINDCHIHSDCIFGCLGCGNYELKNKE